MSTYLDNFEHANLRLLADYEEIAQPKRTWRTPDGRWWTPRDILNGWRPRVSDHWACLELHHGIIEDKVHVRHVELPEQLQGHTRHDPAWVYLEHAFGPFQREPQVLYGRADLATECANGNLFIEMGTCAPAKFVLNLEHVPGDWMLVPYACSYAFVFTATTKEEIWDAQR